MSEETTSSILRHGERAVQISHDGFIVTTDTALLDVKAFTACMYQLSVSLSVLDTADAVYRAKERLLYEMLQIEQISTEQFLQTFPMVLKSVRYATWTIAEIMEHFKRPRFMTYAETIADNPKYDGLDGYLINGKLFFTRHTITPYAGLQRVIVNGKQEKRP